MIRSRDATNKSPGAACRGQRQAHGTTAPTLPATRPSLNLRKPQVTIVRSREDLRRCHEPHLAAAPARQFHARRRIEVAQLQGVEPAHQSSSASGIRVKLILVPTLPPAGGCQGPTLTTVCP